MGLTFDLLAPVEDDPGVSDVFSFGTEASSAIGIFRLLTGTADLSRKSDEKRARCRFNYLTLVPSRARTSDKKIASQLFGEDVNVAEAKIFSQKLATRYTKFFDLLLAELQHCLFLEKRGKYVESFLHLYRALEKLAVAFPLMYIAAQLDFQKVHALLKPLFGTDGGEVSLVEKFSHQLAAASDVLGEYKVSFPFRLDLVGFATLESELSTVVGAMKKPIALDFGENKVDVPYAETGRFVVECRNRLFHNSNTGQRNFDIDRLGGAGELCQGLIRGGLNWLALTYVEVVRNRADAV